MEATIFLDSFRGVFGALKKNWIVFASFIVGLPVLYLSITGPLDAYHEGAIFPPGVAVANGLTIYSEVNHQYGFVHIYINALFFKIFGSYLVVYRMIGLILLLANSYLLYKILWKFISKNQAQILAISTLMISPTWSIINSNELGTVGPWPNVYGITFTLLSILFWWKALNDNYPFIWSSLSGFASALAVGVRIQFLLVVILQISLLIYLFWRRRLRSNLLVTWFAGAATGFILLISFLSIQGALNDAYEQLIVVWTMEAPNSPKIGGQDLLRTLLLFFFFVGTSMLLASGKRCFKLPMGQIIALTSLGVLYFMINFTSFFNSWPEKIAKAAIHSLGQVLFSVAIFLTLSFLYSLFKDLIPRNQSISPDFSVEDRGFFFFVISICMGMFAQFHNLNSNYLWMCIHPFLVWFVLRFKPFAEGKFRSKPWAAVNNFIVFAIIASLSLSLAKIDFSRFAYSTEMLKGVQEHEKWKRDLVDENFEFIRSLNAEGKIRLDCSAGLYSVDEDGYILDSKWTWNEIPFEWRKANIESAIPGHLVLACNEGGPWTAIYKSLVAQGSLEVVKSNDSFTAYRVKKKPKVLTY